MDESTTARRLRVEELVRHPKVQQQQHSILILHSPFLLTLTLRAATSYLVDQSIHSLVVQVTSAVCCDANWACCLTPSSSLHCQAITCHPSLLSPPHATHTFYSAAMAECSATASAAAIHTFPACTSHHSTHLHSLRLAVSPLLLSPPLVPSERPPSVVESACVRLCDRPFHIVRQLPAHPSGCGHTTRR